jgi:lipoprotein-anchoring transpeptidase ErfK/SrfK
MSASELSDKYISGAYKNEYFTERLKALGFYKDENYGADIVRRNAIIRAQSAFNIPITAKIDLNLKRALIEGSDYKPKDVVPPDRPDGMWVVIDKSARILTVYVDGEIFKKYPVAVGAKISLTPEGKFTFVSKAVNPRWGGGGYASPIAGGAPNNPLGKRWMGLSIGGGGSYGVHGNVSPYSIGTNASHGCVRMINYDVEELYEHIKIGTPIWIGTTTKLAEWGIEQMLGSWAPDKPDYRDYMPKMLHYEE